MNEYFMACVRWLHVRKGSAQQKFQMTILILTQRNRGQMGIFHVTHAWFPSGFYKVYHSSFPPLLTSEHHALLNRWPFRHFLNLPKIGMSRQLITDMFQRWDFLNSGSRYNGYLLQTTDADFSLGLRSRGHAVLERKMKMHSIDITNPVCRPFFPNKGTNSPVAQIKIVICLPINSFYKRKNL